jgi:hypothetical protein
MQLPPTLHSFRIGQHFISQIVTREETFNKYNPLEHPFMGI